MTVVSMKAASSRPGIGDLVTRAGTIRTLVRQQAEQTEQARQVSAEAIEQMKQAGLFRIMTPAIYGGYEYGFDALVPVVAQVAAGCGSSGWVFSLGVVHQWLVATMPKEAQDEYWSDPDAISGGSYPPVGKVTRVDGGYRISGNWGFTSGCDHMQWLFLGGMIPPGSEGAPPSPAFFLLPRADVIFDDNWFTMGLSGTGSKTTVADDVFVAEGALADFIDMAKVRTTRGAVAGGNNRMAEFATIQSRVAEATGSIEAARLTISHALDKSRIAGEAGEQADREVRLPNRLAQAFSVKLLVHAIDALFAASGGQSIFTSKPIQRAWRDAHAAGVHVSMNWDAVSTMYGQHALGLDPKGQY
jgi:resorcinol 4-hydroxylase (FADH2)